MIVEEQLLVKYYAIKYLILLKIKIMTDIKKVLLQRFIIFLIKSFLVMLLHVQIDLLLKVKLCRAKADTHCSPEKLGVPIITKFEKEKEKNTHLLKTIFGVLIVQIYS